MHANSTFDAFLHLRFEGKHILFQSLPLESFPTFLGASILTIFICLTERLITYALAHHWSPFRSSRRSRQSRVRLALWRTSLYWIATLCRALYMLVIMSYHLGMIMVTVTALSFGQLLIEYYEAPAHPSSSRDSDDSDSYHMKEPLLNSPPVPPFAPPMRKTTTTTRPRSKSKPEHLFIHPAQSNIAQADIRALELGITMGDTERVVGGNMYFHPHHNLGSNDVGVVPSSDMSGAAAAAWETGKGRDIARALLRSTNTTTTGTSSSSSSSAIHHSAAATHHRHRSSQDSQHFRIDMDDEDDDEDVSDSDSSV